MIAFRFLFFMVLAFLILSVHPLWANVNPPVKPPEEPPVFTNPSDRLKPENPSGLRTRDYSFRPLLIHGKKKVSKSRKQMKVETGAVVQSEVFFVDQNFKKRIFKDEGFSQ